MAGRPPLGAKRTPEQVTEVTRQAGLDRTVDTAVEVSDGVTAEASLSEHAPKQDERAVLIEDVARIRQIRKPFGAATQKLALPKRHGYHRHWFNDVSGRIDEAKESGWSHINGRDGKPLKRAVGTGRDNGVLTGYAMELPEIFWQEDMDARNAEAELRIKAIKESPFRSKPGQAKPSDKGKFYDPKEETGQGPVSIERH